MRFVPGGEGLEPAVEFIRLQLRGGVLLGLGRLGLVCLGLFAHGLDVLIRRAKALDGGVRLGQLRLQRFFRFLQRIEICLRDKALADGLADLRVQLLGIRLAEQLF